MLVGKPIRFLIGLALVAPAERASIQSGEDCATCGGEGVVLCSEHDAGVARSEESVLFCSAASACDDCHGTGLLDCPRCEAESGPRRKLKVAAEIPDLLPRIEAVEKALERPVRFARSPHFLLVYEGPALKIDGKKRSAHAVLHIYLQRLEELYQDYLEVFEVKAGDFADVPTICVWSKKGDHAKASQVLCGYERDGPTHQRGVVSRLSLLAGKRPLRNDEEVFQTIHHHTAHSLANLQHPAQWLASIGAGWADAGVAHWLDAVRLGRPGVFCYDVSFDDARVQPKRWRREVRKLVASGKAPSLSSFTSLDTGDMTLEQHMFAYSIVDYLASTDAPRLSRLLVTLRTRSPTRDAVSAIYGSDLEQLQADWHAWVLREYPRR